MQSRTHKSLHNIRTKYRYRVTITVCAWEDINILKIDDNSPRTFERFKTKAKTYIQFEKHIKRQFAYERSTLRDPVSYSFHVNVEFRLRLSCFNVWRHSTAIAVGRRQRSG